MPIIFWVLMFCCNDKKSNIFAKSEKYWYFPYIKKNIFLNSNFSSSKNSIFLYRENPNIFQISKKCWIFFSKKVKKVCENFFELEKNIFFVGEKFWNFCGISEHVETPKIQIFSPIRLFRNERRPYHSLTPPLRPVFQYPCSYVF